MKSQGHEGWKTIDISKANHKALGKAAQEDGRSLRQQLDQILKTYFAERKGGRK